MPVRRRFTDRMLEAMDRHEGILHGTILAHGGYPFKNTGHGVFAAFEEPAVAVEAAVAAHRMLCGADWGEMEAPGVRWGIHTGTDDPLLGANDPAFLHFDILLADGRSIRLDGLPRFVDTRGRAYLFVPSLPAIRWMSRL